MKKLKNIVKIAVFALLLGQYSNMFCMNWVNKIKTFFSSDTSFSSQINKTPNSKQSNKFSSEPKPLTHKNVLSYFFSKPLYSDLPKNIYSKISKFATLKKKDAKNEIKNIRNMIQAHIENIPKKQSQQLTEKYLSINGILDNIQTIKGQAFGISSSSENSIEDLLEDSILEEIIESKTIYYDSANAFDSNFINKKDHTKKEILNKPLLWSNRKYLLFIQENGMYPKNTLEKFKALQSIQKICIEDDFTKEIKKKIRKKDPSFLPLFENYQSFNQLLDAIVYTHNPNDDNYSSNYNNSQITGKNRFEDLGTITYDSDSDIEEMLPEQDRYF
ncbi:hypothetical protein KAH94_02360 [bacterium]|nr:hypothetical protein [bacterium]